MTLVGEDRTELLSTVISASKIPFMCVSTLLYPLQAYTSAATRGPSGPSLGNSSRAEEEEESRGSKKVKKALSPTTINNKDKSSRDNIFQRYVVVRGGKGLLAN